MRKLNVMDRQTDRWTEGVAISPGYEIKMIAFSLLSFGFKDFHKKNLQYTLVKLFTQDDASRHHFMFCFVLLLSFLCIPKR